MSYRWIRKNHSVLRIADSRVIYNVPGSLEWEEFEKYKSDGGIVELDNLKLQARDFGSRINMTKEQRATLKTIADITGTDLALVEAAYKAAYDVIGDI